MFEEADFEDTLNVSGDLDYEDLQDSISSDVDVEKLVKAIGKCANEVDFLKKLKKSRVAPIDTKIAKLQSNEARLREFIIDLMPEMFPDKNTVDFPGVGKITRKKVAGKWTIDDEEIFKKTLKKFNELDAVLEIKEVLNATKAKKSISKILKEATEDEIEGASYAEPEKDFSLSVQFPKPEAKKVSTTNDIEF